MKSPLIQIKNLHISFLAAETPSVATTLEPFAVKRSSAVDSAISVPALGEFWLFGISCVNDQSTLKSKFGLSCGA